MPWPWKYDPTGTDGGGAVTSSDRLRMGLKSLFVLVGVVLLIALIEDEPSSAIALAVGTSLGGAGLIDLAWLRRGDYDHTLLKDRRQAIVVAVSSAIIGVALVVFGLS